jgi:hypothetical protein
MKRKFYTTEYLEDGQYHFGIKSNRPFFVGKTQSDCQGDEHVMYIVSDTPSHLSDFDISVVDYGLWNLSLNNKEKALRKDAHLKSQWIENDFINMEQLMPENEINSLIAELEDNFADTLKRAPYHHYGYHNPKATTRIVKALVKMGYDVEDHSYSNDESDKLGINGRYCLILPTEVYPLFQLYPYTNEHCEEVDYSQEPQSFKSINQINL